MAPTAVEVAASTSATSANAAGNDGVASLESGLVIMADLMGN
jgi:hypothetical protein